MLRHTALLLNCGARSYDIADLLVTSAFRGFSKRHGPKLGATRMALGAAIVKPCVAHVTVSPLGRFAL